MTYEPQGYNLDDYWDELDAPLVRPAVRPEVRNPESGLYAEINKLLGSASHKELVAGILRKYGIVMPDTSVPDDDYNI